MASILIADDSATDIRFIESVLAVTGHSLTTAGDGEEAERLIRSNSYDLVILDVVMPKKNGFQLCRDLKRDEKFRNIPVVILSSKDQESDKLWGQKQGADEYLTKPPEPMELFRVVKKYLSR